MKNYFTMFFLLLSAIVITGCNTTRGVGQDVEAAGQKIEELAEGAKEELNDDDR